MGKKELIIDKLFLRNISQEYLFFEKNEIDLSKFESRFIKTEKKIEKELFHFIATFKENKKEKNTGNILCFLTNNNENKKSGFFYLEKNKNYNIDESFFLETYDLIKDKELLSSFFHFFDEPKHIGENKDLEIKEIYEATKCIGENKKENNRFLVEGYLITLNKPIIINLENKGK